MTAMDSCESLWTTSVTTPGDDPELRLIIADVVARGCPLAPGAGVAPSKIEAVIPRQVP